MMSSIVMNKNIISVDKIMHMHSELKEFTSGGSTNPRGTASRFPVKVTDGADVQST